MVSWITMQMFPCCMRDARLSVWTSSFLTYLHVALCPLGFGHALEGYYRWWEWLLCWVSRLFLEFWLAMVLFSVDIFRSSPPWWTHPEQDQHWLDQFYPKRWFIHVGFWSRSSQLQIFLILSSLLETRN